MKETASKGRCAHEGADGVCRKAGSNYRNIGCVGPKCPDREVCAHADKHGRCANPDGNSQGAFCCVCVNFISGNAERPNKDESRACACVREGEELPDLTNEDIVSCYLSAVGGVLNVVRFGCMILVKEAFLSFQTRVKPGDPAYGSGLKGWLADTVPAVNYKTAMGFKSTAGKVCSALGVSPGLLMRALNPDPKALPDEPDCEALISARDRLLEIVAGKNSVNALVLWLKGRTPDQLPPADGPAAEDTAKAEEAALDAAKRFARAAADALKCLDNRKRSTVAKDVAKTLRDVLGLKGLAWLAKVLEEAEG